MILPLHRQEPRRVDGHLQASERGSRFRPYIRPEANTLPIRPSTLWCCNQGGIMEFHKLSLISQTERNKGPFIEGNSTTRIKINLFSTPLLGTPRVMAKITQLHKKKRTQKQSTMRNKL